MLEIWNFTVRCDICIRSAISLYSRPSHTSRRTSISLAVSSELSARPNFTLGVLSGKICSPAIVFSITSISFSGLISLYQKLSAFASLALFKYPTSIIEVTIIIFMSGNSALISAAASIPSLLPAVHTSIKIRSIFSRLHTASATSAPFTLAQSLYLPLSRRILSMFSRGIL